MTKPIIDLSSIYSFSDYFRFNYPTKTILKELGYGYARKKINFELSEYEAERVEKLKSDIQFNIDRVGLYSESARKQLVITPILLELCKTLPIQLNIEYPVNASNLLKGVLDYYIENDNGFVVIEAKNVDISKGFTQLAVELIAVDKITESKNPFVYGAVTTGDIWKFGCLDKTNMLIIEDNEIYTVPKELQNLMNIFLSLLSKN